jgi:hypothetical protein
MKVMPTEELSYNTYILRAGWRSSNGIDAYLIATWFDSRPGHQYLYSFPPSFQTNTEIVSRLNHDLLIPNLFRFITHQSYHSRL